jgi:hypothetical protein
MTLLLLLLVWLLHEPGAHDQREHGNWAHHGGREHSHGGSTHSHPGGSSPHTHTTSATAGTTSTGMGKTSTARGRAQAAKEARAKEQADAQKWIAEQTKKGNLRKSTAGRLSSSVGYAASGAKDRAKWLAEHPYVKLGVIQPPQHGVIPRSTAKPSQKAPGSYKIVEGKVKKTT